MNTHILRIDCADQVGLIHRITGVLYRNDLNIISNHEFVDRESGRFFMRTEFSGDFDKKRIMNGLSSELPDGASINLTERRKKDIVIMVTRESHCLGDLLIRHDYDELNANILAVISNHDRLSALVEKFRIPFHAVPHGEKTREEHEAGICSLLDRYNPEYLILAKYMRILSPEFVGRYPDRIINIHHSFLPAFIGSNPYRQAHERGVKTIGATAHFVNQNLDDGPIIAQSVIDVDHSQSVEDMMQSGKDVEKAVLARALKLAFEDRIFVNGKKTIIFD